MCFSRVLTEGWDCTIGGRRQYVRQLFSGVFLQGPRSSRLCLPAYHLVLGEFPGMDTDTLKEQVFP